MEISEAERFSEAFTFLCYCLRTERSPGHAKKIEDAVRAGISWKHVLYLAQHHRVILLLKDCLMDVCPEAVPEEIVAAWEDQKKIVIMRNIFLTKEMGRLISLLESRGIQSLALKGPVLAQVAFGDLNLRSYTDIDLLIKPEDFTRVEEIFSGEGYLAKKNLATLNRISKRLYLWQTGQLPFKKGADIFHVDLHSAIMPPLYSYDIQFSELWDRSREVPLSGTPVRTCGPEDMLQILCYHGAKNRWEHLKHIVDVSEYIRAHKDLNWTQVFDRTRKLGGERILLLGLYLTRELLDASLPDEVVKKIEASEIGTQVADTILERLKVPPPLEMMAFKERFRFQLAIQDSLLDKARYCSTAMLRRVLSVLYPDLGHMMA